jgi:enoyl-CoA hydratase/carnithine racemase
MRRRGTSPAKEDGMELKVTRYAVQDAIATITLHRPERMNTWTGRMHHEYRHCLALANDDASVRAILVTGAGRAFCAGADSRALEGHVSKGGYDPGTPERMPEPGYGVDPNFDELFAYHFGLRKPVIAAINGAAAGVGLVLACFADIRFCAAGAKLTTAHGKLNLPAEYGLSWLLPRLIGLSPALELLISSRIFLAEEAHALRLVHRVCPPERVLDDAREYARNLVASVSPGSLRQTRWQVYRDLQRPLPAAVRDASVVLDEMTRDANFAEGVAAFAEKRVPRWVDD